MQESLSGHNRSFASAFGRSLERPVRPRQLPFAKVNHSAVTLRLVPFRFSSNENSQLQASSNRRHTILRTSPDWALAGTRNAEWERPDLRAAPKPRQIVWVFNEALCYGTQLYQQI